MNFNAFHTTRQINNLKIKRFIDGDGIIVENIFDKKEIEIRFLGIDAPEINYCNKIKKDEKELHIPAAFLIKLGFLSLKFLINHVKIGDN